MALQEVAGTGEMTVGSGSEEAVLQDTPKIRKAIVKANKDIAKLKDDRKAINADIQSYLEGLAALGIPKEAMKRAIKDYSLDEEQIADMDFSYQLCRRALGKPVQGDLFGDKA